MNKTRIPKQEFLDGVEKADALLEELLTKEKVPLASWPPSLAKSFVLVCVSMGMKKPLFCDLLKNIEEDFGIVIALSEKADENKS